MFIQKHESRNNGFVPSCADGNTMTISSLFCPKPNRVFPLQPQLPSSQWESLFNNKNDEDPCQEEEEATPLCIHEKESFLLIEDEEFLKHVLDSIEQDDMSVLLEEFGDHDNDIDDILSKLSDFPDESKKTLSPPVPPVIPIVNLQNHPVEATTTSTKMTVKKRSCLRRTSSLESIGTASTCSLRDSLDDFLNASSFSIQMSKRQLEADEYNPRPIKRIRTNESPSCSGTLEAPTTKLPEAKKEVESPNVATVFDVKLMCRLTELMRKSAESQKALQEFDRKNGLPKSHSYTMVKSTRSRKQLESSMVLSK